MSLEPTENNAQATNFTTNKNIDVMGQEHPHDARVFTRGCKVCDATFQRFGARALETNAPGEPEWFEPTPAQLAGAKQAALAIREAICAFSSVMSKHVTFVAVVDELRNLAAQLDNAGRKGTQWPR